MDEDNESNDDGDWEEISWLSWQEVIVIVVACICVSAVLIFFIDNVLAKP